MPRDGSGIYSLPAGNPVVTNTVIASAWANSTLSDIAAQLNNVFTRDGLLGPTGPFKIQDGTVAAPGLAWNSEPGLGWYRRAASVISVAAQGLRVYDLNANSANNTQTTLSPRAAGTSQLVLQNQAVGVADVNSLSIVQNANGSATLLTGAAGSATRGTLTLDASIVNCPSSLVLGNSNYGVLFLDSNGSSGKDIIGRTLGVSKWLMRLGSGGPVDDFVLYGYQDDGTNLLQNLAIQRLSGLVTIRNGINAGGTYKNVSTYDAGGGATGADIWETPSVAGWNLRSRTIVNPTRAFWQLIIGSPSVCLYEFDQTGQALKSAGSINWVVASDERLKENIAPYTHGLDEIVQLAPSTFTRKAQEGMAASGIVEIGLIAQQTRTALPETVSERSDGYLQLDSGPILFALVNAIKTLNDRIVKLEAV